MTRHRLRHLVCTNILWKFGERRCSETEKWNLLEIANWADFLVTGREHERFEGVAFPDGADANFPLTLAERLAVVFGHSRATSVGHQFVGTRRRRRRGRRRIRARARLGTADLPRVAELGDAARQFTGAHAQVVLAPAVEVTAQAAQSVLEGRRHRHLQKTLAVPQQLHSY